MKTNCHLESRYTALPQTDRRSASDKSLSAHCLSQLMQNNINCIVKIWPSFTPLLITYDRHLEAINFLPKVTQAASKKLSLSLLNGL